ncbi:MAG: peroxiredoxin [Gammaproteobacteria bacterium]|nr:peroxiredoxin [Gammaproteobacteria bacterium]MCP5135754.1 peroxiredoxin [Gammaproteobacteria bacterium]
MLQVGEAVPELVLNDQEGKATTLSDLIGETGLIVYFYPADFTPVCTREACTFRDQWPDLTALGVRVVGISPQDEGSHARFAAEHELPFPLLADPEKVAIKAFGVQGPLGIGVRRATFLVGKDGKVKARAVADFFLGDHKALIEQVLRGGEAGH